MRNGVHGAFAVVEDQKKFIQSRYLEDRRNITPEPGQGQFAAVALDSLHRVNEYRQAGTIDVGHFGQIDHDSRTLFLDEWIQTRRDFRLLVQIYLTLKFQEFDRHERPRLYHRFARAATAKPDPEIKSCSCALATVAWFL
jgi:hypothetical protein